MAYTYDDFQKALNSSGLAGSFSQADLNLARQNPSAGLAILSAKQEWATATGDAQKQAANAKANRIRSTYGGYSGGSSGSAYDLTGFVGNTQDELDAARQALLGIEPYSYSGNAPQWKDPYKKDTQAKLDELLNREPFSYSPATDENTASYRKAYLREGDRAYRENLGQAAAMSGGLPSSYAYTAAAQSRDYYGSQLADKYPELYQAAYNRYLNEYQLDASDLAALRGLSQDQLAVHQTALGQFNADRDFDYGTWQGNYNMAASNLGLMQGLTQDEYNRYLSDQEYNLNIAKMGAEIGDPRGLANLGLDTQYYYPLMGMEDLVAARSAGPDRVEPAEPPPPKPKPKDDPQAIKSLEQKIAEAEAFARGDKGTVYSKVFQIIKGFVSSGLISEETAAAYLDRYGIEH